MLLSWRRRAPISSRSRSVTSNPVVVLQLNLDPVPGPVTQIHRKHILGVVPGHPARVVLDPARAGKHQPAPEPALRVPPVIIRKTPLHSEAGRFSEHSPALGVGDGAMRHTPMNLKRILIRSLVTLQITNTDSLGATHHHTHRQIIRLMRDTLSIHIQSMLLSIRLTPPRVVVGGDQSVVETQNPVPFLTVTLGLLACPLNRQGRTPSSDRAESHNRDRGRVMEGVSRQRLEPQGLNTRGPEHQNARMIGINTK